MKKSLYVVFVFVFLMLSVLAVSSTYGVDPIEEGAENVEEVIDNAPIDPNTGRFDFDRVLNKTKAEQRIDSINEWLSKNSSWLKLVFGMVPEISWVFLLSVYFLLFFFVFLVLNGTKLFYFFSEGKAQLLGLLIFLILVVIRIHLAIAKIVYSLVDIFLNVIIPVGTVLVVIFGIILVAVFIILLIYAPKLALMVMHLFGGSREQKQKNEEKVNREALKKIVDEATRD